MHGYILLKLKSIIKKLSKIRINCSALVYLDVIFEKVCPTPDLAFWLLPPRQNLKTDVCLQNIIVNEVSENLNF